MIEDGIFFDNVFSTGSGTSSSFPGILASSLPLEHGYRGLNDNHKPIAEHLQEAGIQTIGVSASTHVCSLYNYDRGFRKFRDPKEVRENTKKKDI
jgi:arylsulfatase A-like enzyme